MAQVLTREFDCLTCHKPIKIAKLDNVPAGQKKKWERFKLDGTILHQCKKKEETGHISGKNTASVDNNGPQLQIAELSKQVSDLKETVNILISQIQGGKSEIKKC